MKLLTFIISLLIALPAFAQDAPQDSTATNNPQATKNVPRIDYSSQPKQYIIGKLTIDGLKTLDDNIVLSTTGMMVGDSVVIPGEHLSMAAKQLWNQRLFSDIKIETEFTGDSVAVNFVVKERARVYNWLFEGIKKGQIKDLLEKLNLRRGSELSDYHIATSERLIKEYYNEKGMRNAEISYRIEADSLVKNGVNVIFDIEPHNKLRIKTIEIEGAQELDPVKIAREMKNTKKKSINFFADNKFKDNEFPSDLVLIENYLRSKGFRDGEVLEDSLFQIDEKNLGVWIKVKEGQKYYYRDITWVGNSVYTTDHLSNYVLGFHKGDTYDSETMGARLGLPDKADMTTMSVSGLYQDNGYLVFNISPFETVIGDSVDVEIRMVEGKQFRINSVDFDGNTRTNDHVIRRELETLPGDLYSQSLLIRTYQRLASMGQFDQQSFSTPSITPNPQDETVDIKYSLTEVSNDEFELSLGWGSGMFIGSVGINFTNVSLRKFFDKEAWRPYPAGDNQTIGLQLSTSGSYYQSVSLSVTEPWLGGKKATSLSTNVFYSHQTDYYSWGTTSDASFSTIGASASIGKRLNWPDPFFTLQYGLSWQTYVMNDYSSFIFTDGVSHTISATLALARNSVDDYQGYPSTGSLMSLSLAITPPYSAFDGKDYSDTDMADDERYRWIEYHKWNLNATWFTPLTQNRKLVLMTRAQFGYLGSYNPYKISPFEGFEMGGDGLTTYSYYGVETVGLRGYDNGSLTPYSDYGIYAYIYSKYTAELRYPIMREGSTLVYVLGFAEAGNAYTQLKDFKPFELKKAAGVGIRIFLPILGLIGVDWGYGFDVPYNGASVSGSQIHFTMGMQM